MPNVSVSIAKESSVQAINTKIGASTDNGSSADSASLFAKLDYAEKQAAGINGANVDTMMAKADGIGTASDSSATTIFGLINTIKNNVETNAYVEESLSDGQSGDNTAICWFTPAFTRIYNFYGALKATSGRTAQVAIRDTQDPANEQALLQTDLTSFKREFGNAYLEKGKTYILALRGGGTPELSYLTMTYRKKNESICKPTTVAADIINSGLFIPPERTSGSGTTNTLIGDYQIKYAGTLRINITTSLANTKVTIKLNQYTVFSDYTQTEMTVDITVGESDSVTIFACSNSANTDWGIEKITLGYSVSWVIDNSTIIKV